MNSSTFEKVEESTISSNLENSEKAIELTNSSKIIPQSFRLQANQIFLTYKYHINHTHVIDWIINKKYEVEKWIMCHEIGDQTHPYEHTHMAITFKKRVDIRNPRIFDIPPFEENSPYFLFNTGDKKPEINEIVHPHMGKCVNWGACVYYMLKEAKKLGKINWVANFKPEDISSKAKSAKRPGKPNPTAKEVADICDKVVSHNSAFDAIKHEATNLNQVMAINTIFKNKIRIVSQKKIDKLNSLKLYPWQKKMMSIYNDEPNDRDIHWVYDKDGGAGKSTFCSWLRNIKKNTIVIKDTASMRDIADVIRNYVEQNEDPDAIVIDLPRTLVDRTSLYTMLENIKNGSLTCTKYSGTTIEFCSPHVFVFANWKPTCSFLSLDRWHIHKIVNEKFMVEITKKVLASQIDENVLKRMDKKLKHHNFLDNNIEDNQNKHPLALSDIIISDAPRCSIPIRTYTDVQKEVPASISTETETESTISEKELPITIQKKVIPHTIINKNELPTIKNPKNVTIQTISQNTTIPPQFIKCFKENPSVEALILLNELEKNTRQTKENKESFILHFD